MLRASKVFLVVGLLALLAACGGAEPTAVPPPTATTAPPTATTAPPTATTAPPTATTAPPTATVAPPTATTAPPTATVAPTVRATVAATRTVAAGSVTDASGKCRMVPNSVFVKSPSGGDTYATADNLAILIFAGTDTPGLSLEAATTAFIQGFQSVVTGYAETGRQTSKDARGDIQIVTFDGAISGQQAKGVFYFVQNSNILCSLVALAIPPGDQQYATQAQQSAETLEVVRGGTAASTAPSAAPSVAPTRAAASIAPSAAPSVAPTRAAASTAPSAGGNVVTDSSGKCQVAVPASFRQGSSQDNYQTADNLAIVTIGGTDSGGLSVSQAADIYIETFKGVIDGYTEVSRKPATVNGGQEETINFTGTLVGQPVKGVLYFFQVGTTLCTLSGVTIPPGDTQYQADLQAMINSLEPVKR